MIVRHLTSPETRLWLETMRGQAATAFIQGWVQAALEHTGAVLGRAVHAALERTPQVAVDADQVMACLERLVELGELVEVGGNGEASPLPPDAERVFVAAPRRRYGERDGSEVTETQVEPQTRCTNPRRDCARDSDCPEHGRDRPGQGVTVRTVVDERRHGFAPELRYLSNNLCGRCGIRLYLGDDECPICDCTPLEADRRDMRLVLAQLDEGNETRLGLRDKLGMAPARLDALVARLVKVGAVETMDEALWRLPGVPPGRSEGETWTISSMPRGYTGKDHRS